MHKPWMVPIAVALLLCTAIACTQSDTDSRPPEDVLEHHRQYSAFTDPGRYASLYSGLLESIDDLCRLIKRQLIHPVDVRNFPGQVPEDRTYEDLEFPAVEKMLAALIDRDERGLVLERKPEDRLYVLGEEQS